MNIVILHYETETDEQPYDKDIYKNVHSVSLDLTNGRELFFIDQNGRPENIRFAHPVIIEISASKTN